jgi:hypothetical protein
MEAGGQLNSFIEITPSTPDTMRECPSFDERNFSTDYPSIQDVNIFVQIYNYCSYLHNHMC